MIRQLLSDLLAENRVHGFRRDIPESVKMFDKIIGYEGLKRTLFRSLFAKEPVHILLVGGNVYYRHLDRKKHSSLWVVTPANQV